MIVTLILEAMAIPDGHEVRKPTSEKPYTLRHKLNIFGAVAPGLKGKEILAVPGQMFLISEDGQITVILDSMKLAVDYDSYQDMIYFLQDIHQLKDDY